MFDAEMGLRQGYVLAPLLSDVFVKPAQHFHHRGASCGRETLRFPANTSTKDSMVQIQRKKVRRSARHGPAKRTEERVHTLRRLLYTDDAGIVWRSPEGLETVMMVIVTTCAAFGLRVSWRRP